MLFVVRQRSLEQKYLDTTSTKIFGDLHKPVHGPEKRNILDRGVDGGQDDQHEDEGGAGDAGRGHASGCRGQPEHDGGH